MIEKIQLKRDADQMVRDHKLDSTYDSISAGILFVGASICGMSGIPPAVDIYNHPPRTGLYIEQSAESTNPDNSQWVLKYKPLSTRDINRELPLLNSIFSAGMLGMGGWKFYKDGRESRKNIRNIYSNKNNYLRVETRYRPLYSIECHY